MRHWYARAASCRLASCAPRSLAGGQFQATHMSSVVSADSNSPSNLFRSTGRTSERYFPLQSCREPRLKMSPCAMTPRDLKSELVFLEVLCLIEVKIYDTKRS